jgi:hypothetical protein
MKKYIFGIVITLAQALVFYLLPLCAGPTDIMGLVLIMLLATWLLSALLGGFWEKELKFLYPLVVVIFFLPTVFLYYNESATVHALWYLIASAIGLFLGVVARHLLSKLKTNE